MHAVHAGEQQVEEHEIGAFHLQQREGLFARGRLDHLERLGDQGRGEHGAERLVVLDDQDPPGHVGTVAAIDGSDTTTVAPPAGVSSIHIRPPCASTIDRAMVESESGAGVRPVEPHELVEHLLTLRLRNPRTMIDDPDDRPAR